MDMCVSTRDGEGLGSLACCSPWGHKVSDLIEPLNNNKVKFGLRSKNREGTQPYPSTENPIKDLLSMAPSIRRRPSFPLSQSLPLGNFHKPLILLHQRADRLKTTIIEN